MKFVQDKSIALIIRINSRNLKIKIKILRSYLIRPKNLSSDSIIFFKYNLNPILYLLKRNARVSTMIFFEYFLFIFYFVLSQYKRTQ
jgi:hypothetical protein